MGGLPTYDRFHNLYCICVGERGRCLLSTKPKILFCDLTLAAGESKSCTCKQNEKGVIEVNYDLWKFLPINHYLTTKK